MQIAMISDAFDRANIEADDEDAEYLSAEHFQAACETILDDQSDPQGRFREVVRLQKDWILPEDLSEAIERSAEALNIFSD